MKRPLTRSRTGSLPIQKDEKQPKREKTDSTNSNNETEEGGRTFHLLIYSSRRRSEELEAVCQACAGAEAVPSNISVRGGVHSLLRSFQRDKGEVVDFVERHFVTAGLQFTVATIVRNAEIMKDAFGFLGCPEFLDKDETPFTKEEKDEVEKKAETLDEMTQIACDSFLEVLSGSDNLSYDRAMTKMMLSGISVSAWKDAVDHAVQKRLSGTNSDSLPFHYWGPSPGFSLLSHIRRSFEKAFNQVEKNYWKSYYYYTVAFLCRSEQLCVYILQHFKEPYPPCDIPSIPVKKEKEFFKFVEEVQEEFLIIETLDTPFDGVLAVLFMRHKLTADGFYELRDYYRKSCNKEP